MSSPILLDLLTDPLKKKHRTIPKKIHYFWRMNQKPTSHFYKTQIQILFQGSGAKTFWCLVGECPNPELLRIIPFPSLHLASFSTRKRGPPRKSRNSPPSGESATSHPWVLNASPAAMAVMAKVQKDWNATKICIFL